MTPSRRHAPPLLATLALLGCTSRPPQPATVMTSSNSETPPSTPTEGDAQAVTTACQALPLYREAHAKLKSNSTFGNHIILYRPSQDDSRVAAGESALTRADAGAGAEDDVLRAVSAFLHAYLDDLRGLSTSLAAQDRDGYMRHVSRLQAARHQTDDLESSVRDHCGEHLFTNIGGRLPPAVIQANVRKNYGKLRLCYEEGLARKPDLQGRVTVRFVIGRTGRVDEIVAVSGDAPYPPYNLIPDPGTEAFFEPLGLKVPPRKARANQLDDPDVVACMVEHYRNMRFPKPVGGVVTVVYPIVFTPATSESK